MGEATLCLSLVDVVSSCMGVSPLVTMIHATTTNHRQCKILERVSAHMRGKVIG
jgi:hypothetical protein